MSPLENGPSAPHDFAADILAIESIAAIPTILDVVCRLSGLGFAAVARVTEDRWVACQVNDNIAFGLKPGGELNVATPSATRSAKVVTRWSSATSPRTKPTADIRRQRCTASRVTSRCRSCCRTAPSSGRSVPSIRSRHCSTGRDRRYVQDVCRSESPFSSTPTSGWRPARRARVAVMPAPPRWRPEQCPDRTRRGTHAGAGPGLAGQP